MDLSQSESKPSDDSWEIVCPSAAYSGDITQQLSRLEREIRKIVQECKRKSYQCSSIDTVDGEYESNTNFSRLMNCERNILVELDKLKRVVLENIFEFDCLSNCAGGYEKTKLKQSMTVPKSIENTKKSAKYLECRGKSDGFWSDLILFVCNLLLLLVKKPQAVGMRTVTVSPTGSITIAEKDIRRVEIGYWPPEVFRDEKLDEKSFVYTLGAFIVHLITERAPFHQFSYPQLLYNVGSGRLILEPPQDCHHLLATIIVECCRFNQKRRPTFKALCHRYFASHEEEIGE